MNELPINRPSNPFKNQGYMMRLAGQTGAGFHVRRTRRRRRVKRRKQIGGRMPPIYPRTQRGGRLPAGIGIRTQRGGRLPVGIGIRTQKGGGIGAKMHWKMKKRRQQFHETERRNCSYRSVRASSYEGRTW